MTGNVMQEVANEDDFMTVKTPKSEDFWTLKDSFGIIF